MIKKDLPGRTLDFTFDLSTTPVIGRKCTPEMPGEVAKENKVLSPVGTVDLSTWRKPHLSQVTFHFFVFCHFMVILVKSIIEKLLTEQHLLSWYKSSRC